MTTYDDVRQVDEIPASVYSDTRIVTRGYVAGVAGPGLEQTWFFFTHLEPALAFGRAARMSHQVNGYGVYRAADEVRARRVGGDERVLYLTGGSLDRLPDEADHLSRWLRGVAPGRSRWSQPS